MLTSAPESLQTVLTDVNPYFKEHLLNDFKDQNERRCKLLPCFAEFSNVLTIKRSKPIILRDIQLMKSPSFKIKTFELHMNKLLVNVSLEIEKMLLESKYNMFDFEPTEDLNTITECGNMVFTLDNVKIDAIIPLYVEEDSVMSQENFSMSVKTSQITTKKSSTVTGQTASEETIETDKDQSLMNIVWNGLLETISFLIRQDFGSSIVEYSVSELFGDEPEEMISFSNQRLDLANKLIDNFLQRVTVLENKSVIKIPGLKLSYVAKEKSKPTSISFQKGEVSNILHIKKRGTFCVTEEDDTAISLSGAFEIRELTMMFGDCWASHNGVEDTGHCKLVICRGKILLKILLEKNGDNVSSKIDNVQLCWIRDMDCDFNGLKCLNSIEDEIRCYLESYFLGDISFLFTNHLKELFEGVLKQYDMFKDITV